MARLLAIDWDHDQLQIVAASTTRKGVAVEKTLTFPLGEELTAASGEAVGRTLREALRTAGIAPAPIVACVGRERVVVKELRYPAVPAAEEPALVRFQAAKELSELPEDVVIDYAPLSPPDQPGERQALAVALKKSTALAWQALARGLGVRLVALTSRPQALVGAVARAQAEGQAPAAESIAVVAVGGKWAELAIIHQGRMLLARSLAAGAGLVGDVKRSLSVFTSSAAAQAPAVILITGKEDAGLEKRLSESAGIPVQRLEAILKSETVHERGVLMAAVGLAHLWARSESLPINFAAPKQPRASGASGKRAKIVAAAVAAVVVIGAFVIGNRVVAGLRSEVEVLGQRKTALESDWKKMAQQRLDVEALKEWEDSSVSWLDEIYDLTARMPYQIGFRIKDFNAMPIGKRTGKDGYVAQMTITGVAKSNQDALVNDLLRALNNDKHLRATPMGTVATGGGNHEFKIRIDATRQPAKLYSAVLRPAQRIRVEAMDPAEDPPDPGAGTDDDPAAEKGGAP